MKKSLLQLKKLSIFFFLIFISLKTFALDTCQGEVSLWGSNYAYLNKMRQEFNVGDNYNCPDYLIYLDYETDLVTGDKVEIYSITLDGNLGELITTLTKESKGKIASVIPTGDVFVIFIGDNNVKSRVGFQGFKIRYSLKINKSMNEDYDFNGETHFINNAFFYKTIGIGTTDLDKDMVGVGGGEPNILNLKGNSYINGKIGIGIRRPSYPLHVIGESYFNGSIGIGTPTMTQKFNVVGNSYFNGNVGIGISNPGVQLDVAGTIRAHEVKVCLKQGCDFVFEPDYNLMPLEELNHFITTKRHLPLVAPATVMEDEGINLSEMNALLLQKVEELTLYVIELNKEIQNLKSNK